MTETTDLVRNLRLHVESSRSALSAWVPTRTLLSAAHRIEELTAERDDLKAENEKLWDKIAEQDEVEGDLRSAITVAGPRPDIHRRIMRRHREEWPTLWKAIDNLLREDR